MFPRRRALDLLLADANWWLWSVETEREAMRLLVRLARRLDEAMLLELEQAVLAGPPRAMFKDDIEPERWTRIVDREIWLRLAKMDETGAVLGAAGKRRLAQLSTQHPEWRLAADEREEFPFWMGGAEEWHKLIASPRRRRDLVEWLRKQPTADDWQEDDWRQHCHDSFATTACALCALATEGVWPTDRWREALQAWSEEKHLRRSWRYMAPVLSTAPDDVLQPITHGVSWWLRAIARTFEGHEVHFFTLARRLLELDRQGGIDADQPVLSAINHSVGHVTEALLRWWYRRSLEDGQGLPEEIKATFTQLCDCGTDVFRHGRVLLAASVIPLFRVDKDWTMQSVLPLFDWQRSHGEARAAWQGSLRSPRLYPPLMAVLKRAFLDTATHYAELDEYGGQYASLLAFAALDPGDTFTTTELARATRSLPADGLRESAQVLERALDGAGDQTTDYWTNRVAPYLRRIWPRTQDRLSLPIAQSLGRLCVAAQDEFPDALNHLQAWLQPLADPGYLVHRLDESGLCDRFPQEALVFLNLVIGDGTRWPPLDLGACLQAISSSAPGLASDPRHERLKEYWRRHGQ